MIINVININIICNTSNIRQVRYDMISHDACDNTSAISGGEKAMLIHSNTTRPDHGKELTQ